LLLPIWGIFLAFSASAGYELNLPITAQDGVRNQGTCSTSISDGSGDLLTSAGLLRGKCQGNGKASSVVKIAERDALHLQAYGVNANEKVSRSELALTSKNFAFNEVTQIEFDIMIPESADITDSFYYLLQLWQCSPLSPLAGIRIRRGTSHEINFMTRGDEREKGASFGAINLQPGEWKSLRLEFNVKADSADAYFSAWENNNLVGTRRGSFGFSPNFSCKGGSKAPDHYRLKFGIYKAYEEGKSFEVFFDKIRITSRP
jgi:hypothetical protein